MTCYPLLRAAAAAAGAALLCLAPVAAAAPVKVNALNFARAETAFDPGFDISDGGLPREKPILPKR